MKLVWEIPLCTVFSSLETDGEIACYRLSDSKEGTKITKGTGK